MTAFSRKQNTTTSVTRSLAATESSYENSPELETENDGQRKTDVNTRVPELEIPDVFQGHS